MIPQELQSLINQVGTGLNDVTDGLSIFKTFLKLIFYIATPLIDRFDVIVTFNVIQQRGGIDHEQWSVVFT